MTPTLNGKPIPSAIVIFLASPLIVQVFVSTGTPPNKCVFEQDWRETRATTKLSLRINKTSNKNPYTLANWLMTIHSGDRGRTFTSVLSLVADYLRISGMSRVYSTPNPRAGVKAEHCQKSERRTHEKLVLRPRARTTPSFDCRQPYTMYVPTHRTVFDYPYRINSSKFCLHFQKLLLRFTIIPEIPSRDL